MLKARANKKTHPKKASPKQAPIPPKPTGNKSKQTQPKSPKSAPRPALEAPVIPEVPILARFDELSLSEPLQRGITEMGFESPTPIQARAIPVLLTGSDLIGQAQT